MISDLDKYGLVALTVIVVLILFIAMNDMREDEDPKLKGIFFDDSAPVQSQQPAAEDCVVVLEPREAPAPSGEFNFMEAPVECPGERPAPAQSRSAPLAAMGNRQHKIKKGETLSGISQDYYGSSKHWKRIVNANPGVNPKKMDVGKTIVIPALSGEPVAALQPTIKSTQPTAAAQKYKIKRGDSLGKIAKRFYGSSGSWKKIHLANAKLIPVPERLSIGMVIDIPR